MGGGFVSMSLLDNPDRLRGETAMAVEIRELRPDDHDNVRRLWQSLSGSENDIRQLLSHQTGLSIIACQGDGVIGTVLCRYDEHI